MSPPFSFRLPGFSGFLVVMMVVSMPFFGLAFGGSQPFFAKAQSDNAGSAAACPPPLVKPVEPFDLASYLGEWYVQAQAPNSYQPVNTLYCVKATYSLEDGATTPQRIRVNNQARTGSVTGPSRGGLPGNNDAFLQAIVRGNNKGELAVGPRFLPDFLKGPYWIVHYDSDAGEAIITGGAPTQTGENGLCKGARGSFFNPNGNGEGLWVFTREAMPSEDRVSALTGKVRELGLDPSVLVRVPQDGCGTFETD